MIEYVFNQQRRLWIANNSRTIIRAFVLLAIIGYALIDLDVVLADPVMGGSVGKNLNTINLMKLIKLFKKMYLP